MERKTIKIKVEVDTREIDKAIKKIEYLNKQLNEVGRKLEKNVKVELMNKADVNEISELIKQGINEILDELNNTYISEI